MQYNPNLTNASRAASEPAGLVGDPTGLGGLLNGIAALPQVLQLLEAQARDIKALRDEIRASRASRETKDGWMDAKGAAEYLDMSPGTFDKYRYQTTPKIKGYKVGGKTLYKRADLDNFVMLFEVKSQGLA
jgi:hypothetical protein